MVYPCVYVREREGGGGGGLMTCLCCKSFVVYPIRVSSHCDTFYVNDDYNLPLASNPGPYHFDLLDFREKDLGKLPAILEFVRSMDRFDRSFHRFSL